MSKKLPAESVSPRATHRYDPSRDDGDSVDDDDTDDGSEDSDEDDDDDVVEGDSDAGRSKPRYTVSCHYSKH